MYWQAVETVALAAVALAAIIWMLRRMFRRMHGAWQKAADDRRSQGEAMNALKDEMVRLRESLQLTMNEISVSVNTCLDGHRQMKILAETLDPAAKAVSDLPVMMSGLVEFGRGLNEAIDRFAAMLRRPEEPEQERKSGPPPLDQVMSAMSDDQINRRLQIIAMAEKEGIGIAEAESLWKFQNDATTVSAGAMTE